MKGTPELLPEVERDIRTYLWLSHGHLGMYGDDGEMQCAQCAPYGVMDYKRLPLAVLIRAASQARIDVNRAPRLSTDEREALAVAANGLESAASAEDTLSWDADDYRKASKTIRRMLAEREEGG